MKILFSPSETKSNLSTNAAISENSFCCKNLYKKRVEVIDRYQDILNSKDINRLNKIFGLKDEQKSFELAKIDIKSAPTCKAIQRYIGVAYDYLEYENLTIKQKEFIDDNVIIFSNLFGPILAKDNLPIYRLKQGASLEGFKTEAFYKRNFNEELDKLLEGEFIIDLRAGFYEKFYKLSLPYITMKFIKNGKVVSHWAKAYRGKMLKELSKHQPNSKAEFENIDFENLKIQEIITKKNRNEYVFQIGT